MKTPLFHIKKFGETQLSIIPYDGRKWITNSAAIVDYEYVNKRHAVPIECDCDDFKTQSMQYLIPSFNDVVQRHLKVMELDRTDEIDCDHKYTQISFVPALIEEIPSFLGHSKKLNGDVYGWFARMNKIEGYALYTSDNLFDPLFLVNVVTQRVIGAVMPLRNF